MPSVPSPNKCNFLGCKEARSFGTNSCEKHGGKRSEKYGHNAKLYNSTAWKSIRGRIQSEHPICAACLSKGIITATQAIDHVFPHKQDRNKFLINLFQGLCVACHTQKTKLESQGIYRHYTEQGPIDYKQQDYSVTVLGSFGQKVNANI